MTMEESLKALIVERLFLEVKPEDIAEDAPLADYGVDSFLLLELVVALEEMFTVKFVPKDITSETLKSVASLAELIRRKQAES